MVRIRHPIAFVAVAFAAVVSVLAGAATAQALPRLEVRTEALGGGVHFLATGRGGNLAALVTPEGVLLVDAEYAAVAERVEETLRDLGSTPLRYVINTHWHFDHVGGNARFARAGALVIAHRNVRARMAVDQHIAVIDRRVPASPPQALPRITYRRDMTVHLGDEVVSVLHFPAAHSDGDSVVRFRNANVIHTGDIFFHGGYPFIDISSGGSIDGVIAAVDRIAAIADDETRIVPGHGDPARKADLVRYGVMLKDYRARMARAMAAGKTLDDVLGRSPAAELDKVWGRRFFRPRKFAEIVYRSLEQAGAAPAAENAPKGGDA